MKVHIKTPINLVKITITNAIQMGGSHIIMLEDTKVTEVKELLEDIFYLRCKDRLPKGYGEASSRITITQEEVITDPGPGNRVKTANLYVFDSLKNVVTKASREIMLECYGLRKRNKPTYEDIAELKAQKKAEYGGAPARKRERHPINDLITK